MDGSKYSASCNNIENAWCHENYKRFELFTKLDDVLIRNGIALDKINDRQNKNVKHKEIGACTIKDMVGGRTIRTGSIVSGFLARLEENTKESFLKTKIDRDSTLRGLFQHKKLKQLKKDQQGKDIQFR